MKIGPRTMEMKRFEITNERIWENYVNMVDRRLITNKQNLANKKMNNLVQTELN